MNITAEFSAEEFETALITPNDTLSDIHIPILKVGVFYFFFFLSLNFVFLVHVLSRAMSTKFYFCF